MGIVPSGLMRSSLPGSVVQRCALLPRVVLADREVELAVGAEVQRAAVVVAGLRRDVVDRHLSLPASATSGFDALAVKRLTRFTTGLAAV